MDRQQIEHNLQLLGRELHRQGITGEIVIAGGAMMALVIGSRASTDDIDAYLLKEPQAIREAVQVVAQQQHLPAYWLNDGLKGFFATEPPVLLWRTYPGLVVQMVTPEYLLAMKALAGRPHDERDLEALIAYLDIGSAEAALEIIQRYIPERLLVPRVRYQLESLFEEEEGA
jgi:predicted nucleotidyltransferase